jgi:hypothetical protein
MRRFRHLWLSFCRKDQGLGMIEAAVTLPLFLLITFGLMEFGSMFLSRYQVRDVADVVGDYLQANPSASSADLQAFVGGLGLGVLKNTDTDQVNNIFDKIKIQAKTTPMTEAEFDTLCSGTAKDWANPWMGGEYKMYYIHVCYPYTYTFITPLSGLTGGALSETKSLRGKAIAATYPIVTCPAGQFVSNNNGRPVCTQINATCPDGQYMVRLVGNVPACVKPSMTWGSRYRPGASETDCMDNDSSVQVGMSGCGDDESSGSGFDFYGVLPSSCSDFGSSRVWCADLQVQ